MTRDAMIVCPQPEAAEAGADVGVDLVDAGEMGVVGIKRCAQLLQRIEGQLVAEHVGQRAQDRPILARVARCEHRRVAALQSGHVGAVSLGVVSTGKYFAPRLVAELRRALAERGLLPPDTET